MAVCDAALPGIKHLEHLCFCAIRNAGTVICHLHYDLMVFPVSRNLNDRAHGGVFDGVIHQIDNDLHDQPCIHIDQEDLVPIPVSYTHLLYGFTSFASFNLSLGGTTLHLETVMPFLFSGICIAIILLLINSTYGRAFKAIRDDEIAAEELCIRDRCKAEPRLRAAPLP